jgi:4a-hydroxytetrahydrobiopterin dehydratase
MARPPKLSEEEIQEALNELPHWNLQSDSIVREKVAANFAAAVGIVNAIAVIAEAMDHHPDILIYGWNKLRITISTHDAGGLTELDFKLASKIEELNL